MRSLFIIALNELRVMLSDRSIWVNIVVVPLIAAFAAGWANTALGDSESTAPLLDIVDLDDSADSLRFREQLLTVQPAVHVCPQPSAQLDERCALESASLSLEAAQARLLGEQVDATLIIPAGFATAIQAGEQVSVTLRASAASQQADAILQTLQSAAIRFGSVRLAQQMNAQLSATLTLEPQVQQRSEAQLSARTEALWQNPPVQIAKRSSELMLNTGALSGLSQSIPGMGSMYVLFCVLPLTQSFIRDRKQWTLQRLSSMPLRSSQIMGGKVLAYALIGLLQLCIVFGFGMLLGLRFGSDLLALCAVVISFVAAITALALLISTMVQTEQQASGINLLLTLLLAPLGGAWWPLDIVPAWMRVVGHISPIAWAMDAYNAMIFRNAGFAGVWPSVAVLSVMAVLFFGIAIVRFRGNQAR